jgi:hypothetical protein
VDVGYGQLAWSLRQDDRVVVIERTNIRHMDPANHHPPVDLVTIDTSFISLKMVVPSSLQFLKSDGIILALIKPQFEAGKGRVGKGGVVKDAALHAEIIDDLRRFFPPSFPVMRTGHPLSYVWAPRETGNSSSSGCARENIIQPSDFPNRFIKIRFLNLIFFSVPI